jgi:hypothetical protein
MNPDRKPGVGRRRFLQTLSMGAVAAASAPVVATKAAADSESDAERKKARYRESDEVKTYYRVNRYPS